MSRFATRLLKWYGENKRTLPWRGHPDPYAVWVSEIMLQQTRVDTVVPYFERWMARFPDIGSLAAASEHDVLKAWEGLGYYSRARNMRLAAQIIMEENGGQLPSQAGELRKLPGIGRYTAGAIASMAFSRDEPALDGNIRRVLARAFNVAEPADSPAGLRRLWQLAEQNLPRGRSGEYNQALMDLGALICVPANPRCPSCPVKGLCEAYRLGVQDQRPVLAPRKGVPHHTAVAAVVRRGGKVLLVQRPSRGLLGGMWEFPNARVRAASAQSMAAALRKQYKTAIECDAPLGIIRHGYSHFSVEVHVFRCKMKSARAGTAMRWVAVQELESYPMGRIDRQIARKLA